MPNPDGTTLPAIGHLGLWLLVVVADALFAGLPGVRTLLAVPLGLVDSATRWLDRKLNREQRSVANRLIRGILLVIILALAAWLAGWLVERASRMVPFGWLAEGVACACLVLQRRLVDPVRAVARALARHDLNGARTVLARIAPVDGAGMDEHAVARCAIENCAVKLCDGVVTPAFWYLLLGLPALCVVRAVNVIADRIGHGTPRHASFGQAALRLDDALSLLPAVLAGATGTLASIFVPSAHPVAALRVWSSAMRRKDGLHSDRARGVFAGALGVALGGPRRIDGALVVAPWIGDGRARANARDVMRGLVLFAVSGVLFAAVLGTVVLAKGLG